MSLEERVSMLEQHYARLSDHVEMNNNMTAEMYGVFKEMEPGFKFMSDSYSVLSRMLSWTAKAAKILIPCLMLAYMLYMLATKGVVPVGL